MPTPSTIWSKPLSYFRFAELFPPDKNLLSCISFSLSLFFYLLSLAGWLWLASGDQSITWRGRRPPEPQLMQPCVHFHFFNRCPSLDLSRFDDGIRQQGIFLFTQLGTCLGCSCSCSNLNWWFSRRYFIFVSLHLIRTGKPIHTSDAKLTTLVPLPRTLLLVCPDQQIYIEKIHGTHKAYSIW